MSEPGYVYGHWSSHNFHVSKYLNVWFLFQTFKTFSGPRSYKIGCFCVSILLIKVLPVQDITRICQAFLHQPKIQLLKTELNRYWIKIHILKTVKIILSAF